MKFYSSGEDLAKDMGVALEVIEQTHEQHYQAAKKTEKDPDGGSWPAYPSGKSWDEPSGMTGHHSRFSREERAVLRCDHHSCYSLLHGRLAD
jgi:hypothetical protein